MLLILLSLVGLIVFASIGVVTLNYATFLWENKRVNELTSKIKPAESDILHKSLVNREFTSFDLRTMSKSGPAKAAQNLYDRTIILIAKQNYPDWVMVLVGHLKEFRQNAWQSFTKLFYYLLHLAKPNTSAHSEAKDQEHEPNQKDVDTLVNKVRDASPAESTNELEYYQEFQALPTKDRTSNEEVQSNKPVKPQPSEQYATIGLATSRSENDEPNMSLFEKMENRILEKMKTSGLNNYDIWLELGELYIKYGEREKATEVFALVLKHTQDNNQKERARNRLIGL